jgi:mRNA-degrading endonuclease toxin of MazEF toxin-antitoxin module
LTTSFDAGDVVDVPFPFIDLPVRKRRPALVLSRRAFSEGNDAVILTMITSAKRSAWKGDVGITDLKSAGLRADSVVRWKLFTLETALVLSRRGSLAPIDRDRVSAALKETLGFGA